MHHTNQQVNYKQKLKEDTLFKIEVSQYQRWSGIDSPLKFKMGFS